MCGEYVGIDFHRHRSVVVRLSATGERLSVVRIDNSPAALADAVTPAGEGAEVVIEATYGWYWAVDVLQELGATVHLANPKALNWGERRVKNDVVDATDLADMLRLGRLPEAWIAPLANDAVIRDGACIGDPTEGALVVLAAKGGLDRRCASCVSSSVTGPSWCSCARGSRPRCTP
jgi:hypothetical protein